MAPNIVLAPNMMQNAERKHRMQNTNTAHFESWSYYTLDLTTPQLHTL